MDDYNVLLLGADGNAGRNYTKCLKMVLHNNVLIIGTGYNKYQLVDCGVDRYINISNFEHDQTIYDILQYEQPDFIHAQPEEEVEYLCNNSVTAEVFGKNELERKFYQNKALVQQTLGFHSHSLDTLISIKTTQDNFNWVLDHSHTGVGFWVRANNGSGSKYAMPVKGLHQAFQWFEFLKLQGKVNDESEMILSEYLPGKEYAVQLFYIDGELYHAQARERVEHFFAKQMVSGQSSTPSVARTTDRPEVYFAAIDAINKCSDYLGVDPNGIYGVDMRYNVENEPVVTEVNYGRYFTTSDFFAEYGMNTPVAELLYIVDGILPEKKIASIEPDIYWVRGLDMEPVTFKGSELNG